MCTWPTGTPCRATEVHAVRPKELWICAAIIHPAVAMTNTLDRLQNAPTRATRINGINGTLPMSGPTRLTRARTRIRVAAPAHCSLLLRYWRVQSFLWIK